MQRTVVAALLAIVATASAAGQMDASGEIAGHITDSQAGVIPGVRISISGDGVRREAITDRTGRFEFRMLKLGTYRLEAELAGFGSKSGTITLSQATRRAQIAWRLEVGCLVEAVRVVFTARDAAPRVDAIAHFRVESDNGSVLWSVRPDCAGVVRQSYSIAILNAVVRRSEKDGAPTTPQISQWSREVPLKSGGEYVGLFWPEWLAADGLVFPVVAGRVAAPTETAINGMRVEDALKILEQWSRVRLR